MRSKTSFANRLLPFALTLIGCVAATAQQPIPHTIPVVMLSDIHFDPFHDPAKFAQLQAAQVSAWAKVLDAPSSPTQARDFAALQKTCGARNVDTDWALFASSLKAVLKQRPTPLFVTVSGDLIAHQFGCRFQTLAPGEGPSAYSSFAEKTVAFVSLELRLAFPGIPVYLSLGNNDSGCGDYRETPDSEFLRSAAQSFADDADSLNHATVLREFPSEGDYDIALPNPMQRTRLIVIQDIFQSDRYQDCSGTDDRTAAKTQISWLAQHLAQARERGEQVWVMAHIPPGANAFSTILHGRNVCAGQSPEMFLSSEALNDTLVRFADVVRLVIFGHSHTDEVRLLQATKSYSGRDVRDTIPVKLVPAVSSVHGNTPAFVVASIDPVSAILIDYTIVAAGNLTGISTKWLQEYSYSQMYGLPDFSAASVQRLVTGLAEDKKGTNAMSRDYQRLYGVGDNESRDTSIKQIWPTYVCSLFEDHEKDFHNCVCSGNTVLPQIGGTK